MTDDGRHDLPRESGAVAGDGDRAAWHMARAVGGAAVPGGAWEKVHARVSARRRRRRAAAAGGSSLVVAGVVSFVLAGGVTGLSATSARLVGPAGYPEPNATTTLAPSDESFAFYSSATTFDELLAEGPDQETLDVLSEAEELLLRDCMRAAGSEYTPWDARASYEARAQERLVRERARDRQADAFGDPAYAAEHGYGIDHEEWMRVVVRGDTRDGGAAGDGQPGQVGGTTEDPDLVSALLSGPMEDYIEIDMGDGSVLGVPGAGCIHESQSRLWGDYVQATRSRDKVGSTMYPENLRMLASVYDPQLRAADVVWSSCMAGKGWRGLDEQTQGHALVWDDYWSAGRDDAAEVEREVAVADAECVQDGGYADVLAAAEARLVDHLTGDPDVVAYGALVEAALPRAREVVRAEAERVEAARAGR